MVYPQAPPGATNHRGRTYVETSPYAFMLQDRSTRVLTPADGLPCTPFCSTQRCAIASVDLIDQSLLGNPPNDITPGYGVPSCRIITARTPRTSVLVSLRQCMLTLSLWDDPRRTLGGTAH